MKAALRDVERKSRGAGYSPDDIREGAFAVVAFLDEAILSSKDPKAEEWRKKPLNVELFGQAIAGDVFFDKLIDIERRSDSARLADLLEVYLVCLLLGFEGRYAPPLQGEAYRIMERLRERIESIRRTDYRLSPPTDLSLPAMEATPSTYASWRWWVLGLAVVAMLLFLFYRLNLGADVRSVARPEAEIGMMRPKVVS
jgi:type VI secretion system protein ImpK